MITFELDPEQYAQKCKALSARHGLDICGNEGTVEKMGATIKYRYDGSTLTLDITDKPFLISQEQAEQFLKQMVSST